VYDRHLEYTKIIEDKMKFILKIVLFIAVFSVSIGTVLIGCDDTKKNNIDLLLVALMTQTSSPTKLYIFSGPSNNGQLGGRSGADAMCRTAQNNNYGFLAGKTVKAFLSVSGTDQIKDLVPVPYQNLPVFGVKSSDTLATGTQIKDKWTNLWGATGILATMQTATGISGWWWSASDSNGTTPGGSCTGWTNGTAGGTGTGGTFNDSTDPNWIGFFGENCDQPNTVMCLAY
jgi:hypothetical protein